MATQLNTILNEGVVMEIDEIRKKKLLQAMRICMEEYGFPHLDYIPQLDLIKIMEDFGYVYDPHQQKQVNSL